MRSDGAIVSIIPGVSNSAHDAIDTADKIDDIPV
ncbi:DUF6726 family protein [Methylobacter sp.]